MEFFTAVVRSAGFIVAPVQQQFGYVISYRSNVDKLINEVEKLTADRSDKQRIVGDAKKRGEDIAYGVQGWLGRVEVILDDADKLIDEYNKGGGEVRCLNWPFPNLCTRHKLGMEAEKMAQEISKIMAEGKYQIYSFPAPSQMTASSSARGYGALKSRTSMLDEIMQALDDPNIYMIGVHGMGGVGKTTLVRELAFKAHEDRSFNAVVLATISNTPNLRKIQGELADQLGLHVRSETEEGRAGELRGRISREKSILVILDDIWDELDLAELGVPHGDDHKGCRLVLTSRNLNVLSTMGTQRNFPLEVLSEEESWNLFESMAANVVKHDRIKPIAVEVAKHCAGLPLSIVTVAKALRNQDVRVWEDSLKGLRKLAHEGLREQVYRSVELSYDYLESEKLKSLFLLIGCFQPHHLHTEDLLIICWGLGIHKDVDTLAEARDIHYKLIDDLRASAMLLERETELLTVHDLVSDSAKLIAARTHHAYLVPCSTEIEWQKVDQKSHHIIIPHCFLNELPEKLECPELKLLILQNDVGSYLKVPDNFFSGMREVEALYLYGMKFSKTPPPSLRVLANLQSLHLVGELGDIAIVGELKSLEVLILGAEDIIELPKEIGHLTHLRMLNVNGCPKLRLIPKNLLSSLKCLEELYMRHCSIQWEIEGSNNQSYHASLGELRNMHQLTTLELTIEDGSVLPRDLHIFAKLQRYHIFIGMTYSDFCYNKRFHYFGAPELSRTLLLKGSSTASVFSNDGVKDSTAGILHIINSEGHCLHYSFPNLEKLELHNLDNMEAICHGPFLTRSFDMLKVIKVSNCNKLKNLLLWSHLRHLSQLHEMIISECKSMKEIIAGEIREEIHEIENLVLPKLRYLSLKSLPMLLSLCLVPSTVNTGLVPLALIDEKVAMPNLETIELSGMNTCKMWDDNFAAHSCLQNLTSLNIWECDSLTSLFPTSVARAMVKLQHLEIRSCQSLEEIFVREESQGNHHSSLNLLSSEQAILPNLKRLKISKLDNLKLLWPSQLSPNSFCKLNEIEILKCPKLMNVFPSYMLNNLQNLGTLIVWSCDELRVIFEIQELSTVATSQQGLVTPLRTLDLDCLPKLKYIWSKDPHGILRFQKLREVKIDECESLDYDYVFPISMAKELRQLQVLSIDFVGISDEKKSWVTLLNSLPNLRTLHISSLNYLKSLWHNELVAPNSFRKLNKIKISECSNLLNVFQFSMINCLPNLETSEVTLCDALGVVFEIAEPNRVATSQQGLATPLRTLTLGGLPKLNHIWSKDPRGILRFQNLRTVKVEYCRSLDFIFPISVAEDLQHLKGVYIRDCGIEKIVEKSDSGEIKRVYLENLELRGCHRLKTTVPSSVAFHALDMLEVDFCNGVVNIMTSSAATSLSNLRVLKIYRCHMIKDIVASEDDGDAASEIAFMKLEKLEMSCLGRLKSFCRGSYSFKFPSLQTVRVVDCPMMETFCNGNLTAPIVRIVSTSWIGPRIEDYKGRWDGDLNTTIGNIFTEKAGLRSQIPEPELCLSSSKSEEDGSHSSLT